MDPDARHGWRWLAVVGYVTVVYATIPFAQQGWIELGRWAGVSLETLALLFLALGGVIVLACAIPRFRLTPLTGLGTIAVAGAYLYVYAYSFVAPAEKIHLLEYGFLPWVVWWAYRSPARWSRRALLSTAVACGFGVGDELVQAITPDRFAEFRDVLLNWQSAVLGMLVWLLIRRPWAGSASAAGLGPRPHE